jgi:membrane fusion protein, heavy metal efflux system
MVNTRLLYLIALLAVFADVLFCAQAAAPQPSAHAAKSLPLGSAQGLRQPRALAQPRPNAPLDVLKIAASSKARRELVLVPVIRKPVTARITATAIIEPDANAVAQVTSEIPARVVRIIAQLGQQVRPGELLAIMSSVELGDAKTHYLKVRSLEGITNQHVQREQALYAKKITPMKDLLEARAQHDAALAEYQAARERLRLLIPASQISKLQWSENGQPLSEFPLTSPIAGTLVKRDLSIGAMVDRNGSAPLMIINLERVWVIANVFEHDLASLKTGDQVNVSVDAYADRVFSGQITYIGNEVDRSTRAVRTRIEVPNPDHLLKPGMFAKALIAAGNSREVLVAPESAIYQVRGRSTVFVAAGDDEFEVRPVQLGSRGDDAVEILAGLEPGDVVVARGGLALKSLIANQAAD